MGYPKEGDPLAKEWLHNALTTLHPGDIMTIPCSTAQEATSLAFKLYSERKILSTTNVDVASRIMIGKKLKLENGTAVVTIAMMEKSPLREMNALITRKDGSTQSITKNAMPQRAVVLAMMQDGFSNEAILEKVDGVEMAHIVAIRKEYGMK